MLRYVSLISGGPTGAPSSHPQNKLQRPFLALLYMRHVRSCESYRIRPPNHPPTISRLTHRHSISHGPHALCVRLPPAAGPLMREFIREGGLLALVALFEAENTYLRGQRSEIRTE